MHEREGRRWWRGCREGVESRPEQFSGRAGLKKILLFRAEKILPMTIPLDASGLNFWAGLGPGPGLGRPPAHFIV
jgi:hypothetical protein